jgi:hypothetical protein
MECFFLASDWITGLAQLVLEGKLRGHSEWQASEGWSLGLAGLALLLFGASSAPLEYRLGLELTLGLWTLFSAAVLWMRVKMAARNIVLLMSSALLLSGPVLVLGGMAFHGVVAKLSSYWAAWAWFFAWGVFYIQAWMRGNTLPRWRIMVASLPFLAQAGVLAYFSRWPGTAVLLLLSARIVWRLKRRLECFEEAGSRPRTPTSPAEIRVLGFEQVAWSLVLSLIWVWHYLP